ncbi:hypothetical protein RHSIM_Rhsim09G0050700 [Rhododendron simsii]|uniref:UDP-glucose 4-epimerase n=1 Tax=Rhododendron simsii TaxID=118357 RepID=A0A834LBE5_RHOSS|nr:hypothetical protein RHSIM_Rhsim09G0050700 [Rhododendron simsii]
MGENILVTGGAGYIGSHTVLQLLQGGYKAVVIDNLDNSSAVAIDQVQELAGEYGPNLTFHQIDLRDKPALEKLFATMKQGFAFVKVLFDAVIHFAGLKAVGESVQKPLMYYDNNLIGTITLLEVMAAHGCINVCLVCGFGLTRFGELTNSFPSCSASFQLVFSSSATVYGWPKVVPCTEEFALSSANPYGRTKDPRGIPNNLMPFVQQVAVGRQPALSVFGTDYPTKDGTGKIPLQFASGRAGDAEIVYASTDKAEHELNWK